MVARATPFSATFRCFRRLLRQSHTRSASNGAARTKKHGSVPLPSRYDVCIVGGGVMGSASAFFLASRMPRKSVCVIERDFSYEKASSMRSFASIRQQFSCPENIQMSLYSLDFLRNVHKHLEVEDEDRIDVNLVEKGYLFLSSEEGEDVMKQNHTVQREFGVHVDLLSSAELAKKFSWLNTEGVSLASYGFKGEGWFDPWILLSGLKNKAIALGTDYVCSDVVEINVDQNCVKSIKVRSSSSEEQVIECDYLVNAGGPWAAELATMAGIGGCNNSSHTLKTGLPVEPRLRSVFVFKCPTDLPDCPLVIDGHVYFRRESAGTYLAGMAPPEEMDKTSDGVTMETDHQIFDDVIWPAVAKRVPAFEELKVQNGWSGYYEYNTLDQNAIIGVHPVIKNYVFINGFSGHGLQMSPAAGRAVSEIILDGKSHSIDLTKFSFQRVLENSSYGEKLVV